MIRIDCAWHIPPLLELADLKSIPAFSPTPASYMADFSLWLQLERELEAVEDGGGFFGGIGPSS